jgi:hypothetical protein
VPRHCGEGGGAGGRGEGGGGVQGHPTEGSGGVQQCGRRWGPARRFGRGGVRLFRHAMPAQGGRGEARAGTPADPSRGPPAPHAPPWPSPAPPAAADAPAGPPAAADGPFPRDAMGRGFDQRRCAAYGAVRALAGQSVPQPHSPPSLTRRRRRPPGTRQVSARLVSARSRGGSSHASAAQHEIAWHASPAARAALPILLLTRREPRTARLGRWAQVRPSPRVEGARVIRPRPAPQHDTRAAVHNPPSPLPTPQ